MKYVSVLEKGDKLVVIDHSYSGFLHDHMGKTVTFEEYKYDYGDRIRIKEALEEYPFHGYQQKCFKRVIPEKVTMADMLDGNHCTPEQEG